MSNASIGPISVSKKQGVSITAQHRPLCRKLAAKVPVLNLVAWVAGGDRASRSSSIHSIETVGYVPFFIASFKRWHGSNTTVLGTEENTQYIKFYIRVY
jgi:hypothetical protein